MARTIDPSARSCTTSHLIGTGLNCVFKIAEAEDDSEIRQLLREIVLPGRVRISIEREPNYFSFASAGNLSGQTLLCREGVTDRLLAMGTRAVWPVFVNGALNKLGYLSHLRVVSDYQGRSKRILSTGFERLLSLRSSDELEFDLMSLVEGNSVTDRLFNSDVAWLPKCVPYARFATFILPVKENQGIVPKSSCTVEKARREHITGIIDCLNRNLKRYQCAPCWSKDDLFSTKKTPGLALDDFYVATDRERVIGCIARWDQQQVRQVKVEGEPLRCAFLSHVAVEEDEWDTLSALIDAVLRDPSTERFDCLIIGFAENNRFTSPLLNSYYSQQYWSQLYFVDSNRSGDATKFMDQRVPHVEVSLL